MIAKQCSMPMQHLRRSRLRLGSFRFHCTSLLGVFLALAFPSRLSPCEFSVAALSNMPEPRRALPEKLLIGYATNCNEKVVQAVQNGVNVVIWSFVEMLFSDGDRKKDARCVTTFDIDCAKSMIQQLDEKGYRDTVHLVSFGGWNGPHLPDALDVIDMYQAWKNLVGETFHGVDWDLEGHDDLQSPTNVFSIKCLEAMGRFSELAKRDGYIVGMAPPQSYLDIDTSRFSRSVNLTDPDRGWHEEFHYFGYNVYAYLLSKYNPYIDFVSVQFYESYARAGLQVFHNRVPPETYLQNYVQGLLDESDNHYEEASFFVDFDRDLSLNYTSQQVFLPLSKLVFGFANGWGAKDNDKVCYFDPKEIGIAYTALQASHMAPRGFMFWVMYVVNRLKKVPFFCF